MTEDKIREENNAEADSSLPEEAGSEGQGSLETVDAKESEVNRKGTGISLKRAAGVLGFIVLLAMLAGSVYYLRGIGVKLYTLDSRLEQYELKLDNSISAGHEDLSGSLESIKKSISDAGGESSESLKRVLVFLGDLRFKIKELENRITEVSQKREMEQTDSGTPEGVDNAEGEADDSEGEADSLSADVSGESQVENLTAQNSAEIRELDEEFIGEVLDRMLAKKLDERDLSRKEEALKKKREESLRELEKNEKMIIAIENSVKRVAEIGKNALVYCKEKVVSVYEALITQNPGKAHE